MSLFVSSIILYVISQLNYLLFHSIAEGFAIVVAMLIHVLATRTYQHSKNDIFLFLGIAYLHIAILDFAHTLTYKGMGVFPNFDSDVPTQLWIAGRMMEAVSFFVILFIQDKQIPHRLTGTLYTLVTAIFLLSTMVYKIFPVCFIEGQGLTRFKVLSEYLIVVILLISTYILWFHRDTIDQGVRKNISISMLITALSELAFTLYTDVYGISNMLGHLLKVISYYYIYAGVVVQGIDLPYSMVSSELRHKAIKDPLTGLYNRQGLLELLEVDLAPEMRKNNSLGVLMIDLDNFKFVNDNYGHLYGDKVLNSFATLLENSIRQNDAACRYGGDEFVVLARNVNCKELTHIKQRITNATENWLAKNEKIKDLGISIGTFLLNPGEVLDTNKVLKMADKSMYAVKQSKKVPR